MPLREGYQILEENLDEESNAHEKTLDETFEEMKKISTMDTFWSACNSVQGLTILAMPLVTSFGGYWLLFGITAIAVLSNYTSKILIQCLYEECPGKGRTRVRNTFADIGDAFWPTYGRHMVDATKFLELIFVATVNPIACGEAIYYTVPYLPVGKQLWILIFGLAMIPNVFLSSVKLLSKISMLTIFFALTNVSIIVAYCLGHSASWKTEDLLVFDPVRFPLALGVVLASFSSQIYLTVLEGNMRRPEKFNTVINYAYIAMTELKIGVGAFGYLTFSGGVSDMVSNNLPLGLYRVIVNIVVTVLLVLLRFMLTSLTILMAVLVPHFTLFAAFIGSGTGTVIALVFPSVFYVKIFYWELRWHEIVLNVFIVCFALLMAASGMVSTGRQLYLTFTAKETDF
ncbi:vesicular inhibitory amino acid transporter-like [Stylophora pistillata]|uniref:vesicular inhibitory amino acid transporter-like n=1 Tax=Stylophora pistillata TaxID=50429 RepID=UPI000C038F0F|nr:vesicular inhibitory amino acid transporter-like [Stylophora pistillata]